MQVLRTMAYAVTGRYGVAVVGLPGVPYVLDICVNFSAEDSIAIGLYRTTTVYIRYDCVIGL